MQFNHFPNGSFLFPWQPSQNTDHYNYSYIELLLPKQLLYHAASVVSKLSFEKVLFQN